MMLWDHRLRVQWKRGVGGGRQKERGKLCRASYRLQGKERVWRKESVTLCPVEVGAAAEAVLETQLGAHPSTWWIQGTRLHQA